MADNRKELLGRLSIAESDRDGDEPGNGWRTAAIVFLLIALGTSGGLAYLLLNPPAAPQQASAPVAPAASAPAPGAGPAAPPPAARAAGVLSGSGYVVARRQATVSAEITGLVAEVLIEEGMKVEEGQVVARLDATLARIDLATQEAKSRAAAADAAEAQRNLQRLEGLQRGSVVSEAQLTAAKARAQAAAARAEEAREVANRSAALLAKYEIRAPFAGVVTTKDAQPGEIVSPAAAGGGFTRTGICTVVDMNSLEIEVDVNEAFISRVRPGQKVRATLDAYPDWEIPATVAAIIPTADRARATVRVRIAIETRDPRILPEMAAKVNFLDEDARAGVNGTGQTQ